MPTNPKNPPIPTEKMGIVQVGVPSDDIYEILELLRMTESVEGKKFFLFYDSLSEDQRKKIQTIIP